MIATFAAVVLFQSDNMLTAREHRAGYKLLFDGKTTNGWHNFMKTGVGPGWTIKDGVLSSSDPHTAGDIVSEEKFEWFDLWVDYNVSKGGNSGRVLRDCDQRALGFADSGLFQHLAGELPGGRRHAAAADVVPRHAERRAG